jgi:hypothetical protein
LQQQVCGQVQIVGNGHETADDYAGAATVRAVTIEGRERGKLAALPETLLAI